MQSRKTREGSRFAQLVQQVAVPSWMHGAVAPSAPSHAPSCTNAASDVLAQIDASMDALRHASAGAAPAKTSAAGDILAMLEASLQPPSPQQEHTLPALAKHSGSQLAADDAREIDKLLSNPASSQRATHQPAVSPHDDRADQIYGAESSMQQLLPGRNALGYHSATKQEAKAVYADVHTAPQAMQQGHEWIMDSPALGGVQNRYIGEHFPNDHRCDRTSSVTVFPET